MTYLGNSFWMTERPRLQMEADTYLPNCWRITVNHKALLECDGLLEWAESLGFSFGKVRPFHCIEMPWGEHNDIYRFIVAGSAATYFKLKWGGN